MKSLIWSMSLVGLLTGSAQAFDYVDSRGFRHWNHDRDQRAEPSKEVVQNPGKGTVKIVEDTVKFVPIDEPATRAAAKE